MIKFVVKRILLMIGVVLIVFCINQVSGDPVAALLPADATQEQYDMKKAELGLDKPLYVQFFNYMKGLVTEFDLGTSYQTNRPVRDEIMDRYPTSIKLALISIAISILIGIPFGIISATKQYSIMDYSVTMVALFFASMPPFWLGLMAMIIFSLKLGWLPASGLAHWQNWVLPSLTLGLSPVAVITRTTRSSMLDIIRQDYVRTARAKGLSEGIIIYKHALRNALIPVITVIGLQLGFIVGGAMVVEAVFSIPGLGSLMMTAINQKNFPVIQGSVLVLAITVCVLNLLVDLMYAFVDPRIKAQYTGSKKKTANQPKQMEKEGGEPGEG